jgi:NAD(P)-dependent dehydrogenase (short-subunit alcohol dehydrogenase family)
MGLLGRSTICVTMRGADMREVGVAIVTGGGSGIGRAVAHAFLREGFRVALLGRDESRLLDAVANAPAALRECAMSIPTDVRSAQSVEAAVSSVVSAWGRIDVLFNNAGRMGSGAAFEDLPLQEIEDVIATNLTGSVLVAQSVYRAMKAQSPSGGRIINNGSISAHVPRPHSALYTSTKHAITGLTRALSLDGRAHGIACGQIDIGNAATAMTAGVSVAATQANGTVMAEPTMDLDNVADAVLMMARLPLSANVQFLTVMATTMPFIGRG